MDAIDYECKAQADMETGRRRKRKRKLLLLAAWLLLEEEDEEWLYSLDRQHRQDVLKGKAVNRRKQPEERWWYREDRHKDSKRFCDMFRTMRAAR